MIVVVGRVSWCVIVVGGDSWLIDVPVVQYFGLTGGGCQGISSVNASLSNESFID